MRQKGADMREPAVRSSFERIDTLAGDLVRRCEMVSKGQAPADDKGRPRRWGRAAVAKLKAGLKRAPPSA
ncbi:MAG: hypothetical protein AAF393_07325 [Pseudomonadota bacterium]